MCMLISSISLKETDFITVHVSNINLIPVLKCFECFACPLSMFIMHVFMIAMRFEMRDIVVLFR